MKTASDADIPLHLLLGNHDNRDLLLQAFPEQLVAPQPVKQKLIHIIEAPHATWVLLDSLHEINTTPGMVGQAQLDWLAGYLDVLQAEKGDDAKVLVMVHHNPPWDEKGKKIALLDSEALLDVLVPRRIVKAMFFGHTHRWTHEEREGLHLVGLPATAYVFEPGQPSAWVLADVSDFGVNLTLQCLDPSHPFHKQMRLLSYRKPKQA